MIIERRCLTCSSTRGTPAPGGEMWFDLDVPTGLAAPFCTTLCALTFATWDRYTQLEAVYGSAKRGLGFLAAIQKLTLPLDSPYIYPAEKEGGKLRVGTGRVYRIVGQAGELPQFAEYFYGAVTA